jgi:hypothetical protein
VVGGSPQYAPQPQRTWQDDFSSAPQSVQYYDQRTYNYYGSAQAPAPAPKAQDPGLAPALPSAAQPQTPAAPAQQDGWAAPAPQAQSQQPAAGQGLISTAFRDRLHLHNASADVLAWIDEQGLWLQTDGGKPELALAGATPQFDGFAALSGDGDLVLVVRADDDVVALHRQPGGALGADYLPYNVDFSGSCSLGLVSGELWFSFDATDGTRYVAALRSGGWTEVGSGTHPSH